MIFSKSGTFPHRVTIFFMLYLVTTFRSYKSAETCAFCVFKTNRIVLYALLYHLLFPLKIHLGDLSIS